MSIPKKIHYCWFGGQELPEIAIHCMSSWKKHCPDYQVIRWDETNTDLESCSFVKEAYARKKWAFVSDYIRLKVIESHGGIYLDIDVELLKPLDELLCFSGYMGLEQNKLIYVNTGLGFGAEKKHLVIRELMSNYENTDFVKSDGSEDLTSCPIRDTEILKKIGLLQKNQKQTVGGISILPTDYLCPRSILGQNDFTHNTISIHHFNGSWVPDIIKHRINRKKQCINYFGFRLGIVINYVLVGWDELIEFGIFSLIKRSVRFVFRI